MSSKGALPRVSKHPRTALAPQLCESRARGFETYRNAAALFRLARSQGVSLTTTDAIIATVAAENIATIFSLDRDFIRMAHMAGFRLHQP